MSHPSYITLSRYYFFILALFISSLGAKERKSPILIQKTMEHSQTLSKAYFASGCFWCVEAVFESVKGVREVVSGYSGGKEENPTYKSVSSGNSGHAESVEVLYDPKQVSFEELVEVFFESHDPTQLNGQGPDRGRQYRSIAFYQNEQEKKAIESYIKKLETKKVYDKPIVTQVLKFQKFWKAEDYHQDYEKLNPNQPYIRQVSVPRLRKFQSKYPQLLKEDHKNTH